MRLGQRLVPAGPAPLRQQARVEPFAELRRPGDGGLDRLAQHLGRQAGGHRIDRLDDLDLRQFLRRHHVVGMHHVEHPVTALDPAADGAQRTHWQGLFQVVAAGIEEHQVDEARRIGATHLVGRPRIVRLGVAFHPHHDGDDAAIGGGRQMRLVPAVDQPGRQVPEQVHHQRPGQFLHRLRQPLTDAGQTGYWREQGIQDIRSHRSDSRKTLGSGGQANAAAPGGKGR